MTTETKTAARRRLTGDLDIYEASALILRAGVSLSALTMAAGVALTIAQGRLTFERMRAAPFSADILGILRRSATLDGQSVTELGILFLVLTPILRVASSMVLFAVEEGDVFYTAATAVVLVLTLLSLLVLN
jgi:uncharacterized membrane protein